MKHILKPLAIMNRDTMMSSVCDMVKQVQDGIRKHSPGGPKMFLSMSADCSHTRVFIEGKDCSTFVPVDYFLQRIPPISSKVTPDDSLIERIMHVLDSNPSSHHELMHSLDSDQSSPLDVSVEGSANE